MISGIGIDLIETSRIKKSVQDKHFREKVFSKAEIDYCEKMKNKEQHYAARFAAKEALLKAMGTGLFKLLSLNEIEIGHDKEGKPLFRFLGNSAKKIKTKKIKCIHLSISHLKSMACAMVVIES